MTDEADPRAIIRKRVLAVRPFDGKEAADQAEILRWVDSGAPLYRTAGPDSPPQHLCVYFALIDDASRSVLLIHHVKAQMWLLPGGHVDEGEDPRDTAEREAMEELGIDARFHPVLGPGDEAFFVSITKTGDDPPHVDVTLWFVLACAQGETLRPDPREISAIRWAPLDDPGGWAADCYDPQMGRFTRKLTAVLVARGSDLFQGARRVSGDNRGLGGILMTSGDQIQAGTGQAVMGAWQTLGPLMDLVTPMALRVAATLRLADFMPDDGAGEGVALGDLAERAGADPDALARMLRHLVQHGVFTEPRPGQFAANQTAALLRAGQPGAVWLDLDGFGGRMDLAFTGLLHTVRTGEPAWEQVFGQPFWAYLDANPAISASFDATMAVDAGSAAVADGYDWTTVRHVTDIGGGTGTLIAEVLRRHPHLHGTLAELPETAARAREYLAGLGLDGRCEVVGRSFFDPLPAGADAYLLSRVIHDWDDDAAIAILRRCAEAAGSAGRVLVIESHGTADGDPGAFAEMNLRMLVLAGGRERTIDHYSALATAAGLRVTAVHDITERHMIIECVPV